MTADDKQYVNAELEVLVQSGAPENLATDLQTKIVEKKKYRKPPTPAENITGSRDRKNLPNGQTNKTTA